MTIMPPKFEYEPVAPFHAISIEHGTPATTVVTDDLHHAIVSAWGQRQICGTIIDGAGYAVAWYRTGYMAGVSAVFEVISNMTVERNDAFVYEAMLDVELYCRLNWSRL